LRRLAVQQQGTSERKLDTPPPDRYKGDRKQLWGFLTQARWYLAAYATVWKSPADMVMQIARLLEGDAFNWVEPHMREYMENVNPDGSIGKHIDNDTKEIFSDNSKFEDELKKTFREIDEEKKAVREIYRLKQKGSASTYYSEFQRLDNHIS
jgi:hypothetical protein